MPLSYEWAIAHEAEITYSKKRSQSRGWTSDIVATIPRHDLEVMEVMDPTAWIFAFCGNCASFDTRFRWRGQGQVRNEVWLRLHHVCCVFRRHLTEAITTTKAQDYIDTFLLDGNFGAKTSKEEKAKAFCISIPIEKSRTYIYGLSHCQCELYSKPPKPSADAPFSWCLFEYV